MNQLIYFSKILNASIWNKKSNEFKLANCIYDDIINDMIII